ncbi:Rop family plasmid primer RNA-binding protein [Candidatus Regiella insecticola]|uniref:Regulatory protein Rop n=1 Tax=Candidatus Regiella insecticola TaxID=138073 RepID=A0A6L2ZSU7_9ENTR|nr:Rop family plasmid primer RNA-binding protein [Candidatus Regiella insecticola]GFN47248.1 regulatory protein Rop [Candidatus Regiella insecticola]
MAKKSPEQTVANMAKFLQSHTLDLLGKLEGLGWDEEADDCDELNELAGALHQKIKEKLSLPPD